MGEKEKRMIALTEAQRREQRYDRRRGLLGDDVRLMYPPLADIDPEDWEDASIYDDQP